MSWFKTPSEYRRYADGRIEIIERRSLLKISLAALGSLALLGGTAAIVMNQSPMGPGGDRQEQLNRHPELTKDITATIIREQDRGAIYRILPRYESLDFAERLYFWQLVMTFDLTELKAFGRAALEQETNHMVRARIEAFVNN